MALRGAPEKPNAVNRNPKVHDWLEFENVPYSGVRPELPKTREVRWVSKDDGLQVEELPLKRLTLDWWDSVTTLPHCGSWSSADWAFAVATALIADAVFCGDLPRAAELRQRETLMWVTADARRSAKVRYVAPKPHAVEAESNVTVLDEFRDL